MKRSDNQIPQRRKFKRVSKSFWILIIFVGIIFSAGFVSDYQLDTTNSFSLNISLHRTFFHISISDPNLMLYLPFDVQEGLNNKTRDYTDNLNDGLLENGILWNSSGYIGEAYEFDGVDDYLEVEDDD